MNNVKKMKLSQFAKQENISYQTAYKHWEKGNLDGEQLPTGTIRVTGWKKQYAGNTRAIVYARNSNPKNLPLLEEQSIQLKEFAEAQGFIVVDTVTEIAYGFHSSRPKLIDMLMRDDWDVIVIQNPETLVKFSFQYLKLALSKSQKDILCFENLAGGEDTVLLNLMTNTSKLLGSLIGVPSKNAIRQSIERLAQ